MAGRQPRVGLSGATPPNAATAHTAPAVALAAPAGLAAPANSVPAPPPAVASLQLGVGQPFSAAQARRRTPLTAGRYVTIEGQRVREAMDKLSDRTADLIAAVQSLLQRGGTEQDVWNLLVNVAVTPDEIRGLGVVSPTFVPEDVR